MRIVMDVRTVADHFPGIGRYAYQLARAVAQQRDRGELVLVTNPKLANSRFNLDELVAEPGVRMVSTSSRPFTFQEQMRYPRELYKLAPSAVHFPYMVMPYAAPRPVILTIHDIIPVIVPGFFSLRQRLLYRFSLWIALRTATAVICVSEATRAELISFFGIDSSRLAVIHEGVEKTFRPCSREEIEKARQEYALPPEYLLYLGSNKPHKNLPALIRAYESTKSALPLVVAGSEDPRFQQARRLVGFHGIKDRVLFPGTVSERQLPAVYSGASAFLFPSLNEGFGLPPLEAMACGVPVACSDIPSLRETVGDAALFFDPKDGSSIAAAIDRILTDQSLRAHLHTAGFHRTAELSWETAAQKTLAVFSRVAARKIAV